MNSHIATRISLIAGLLLGGWLPTALAAPLGTAFIYQGRLLAGGGAANGIYDLRFTAYDALAGASPIAGPLTNDAVVVTGGIFTSTLDFGPGIFTGESRWLEVAVRTNGGAAFTALAPRQPFLVSPYALFSSVADRATTADAAAAATTAGSFSGSLAGDVTGTQSATVVARVGGQTAAEVATATSAANGATSASAPGTLVRRDAAGGFAAGTITAANFSGNGAGLTNLNASHLTSGTVPDSRLADSIARTNKVWLLGGNSGTLPGTQFLGTKDKQALELSVNGARALRLEPNDNGAPNFIGGAAANSVAAGVRAATIGGGGGTNSGGTLWRNTVKNDFGTVGGGGANTLEADALGATIGGGALNVIQYNWSTIAGGYANRIDNYANGGTIAGGVDNWIQLGSGYSSVGGGNGNIMQGAVGTIAGGEHNTIGPDATDSFIGGGDYNSIQSGAIGSAIAGGGANSIQTNSISSAIGGGVLNTVETNAQNSTISGGDYNRIRANAWHATVGGGAYNTAGDTSATVSGGFGNTARARDSVVGGGFTNSATGLRSTVPGGYLNEANGDYSFAAGRRAKANHGGSFVWADSADANFVSTGNDQFLVRAVGGVGIGTNNPAGAALNVAGAVWANAFVGSGASLSSLPAPAANTITSTQLAFDTGSLGKMTGSLTQNSSQDLFLNDHIVYLRGDPNHGLGWYGGAKPFAGVNVDGPVLFGYNGGALGVSGPEAIALSWDWRGNVTVSNKINVGATVVVDSRGLNAGSVNPGITFGPASGEGIASKRTSGGNQYGLDFFTGFTPRMRIFNSGGVNIGGANPPEGQLEVASGGWAPQLRLTQNDNGNWARLVMGVAGSAAWTLSVGTGTEPSFNFWNGSANVALLSYSGNLWIQGLYQSSDRNAKTNFTEVEPRAILDRVLALPLQRWTFTNDLAAAHLGPMAQDFHAAFGLGADDKHIATVDADGVALAAIQGLNQKLEEREARILALERTVAELKTAVATLAATSAPRGSPSATLSRR
ncbi:MAG TPA: tail fiber domain-containing protein [Verrucomicrobiae bacterium]